ncbi:universal stress protein [Dactylosporangium sp. NPDC005555]|uniref:universal stress protein n=1 Tax=Dactylosporangium sp. NPDC005555 TaxID=3154889 RepID=UPI0033B851A8
MGYQYGPVVVGVDGSAESIGALRWAADEACQHTRELLAVHAFDPALPTGDAPAERADIAVRAANEAVRWRPGVCATGVTETGAPADVLRRYAEHARLVVVASHGRDKNAAAPLGSVCAALCVRAECPVLVVHGAQRWADPFAVLPRTGPVVVGFDGSDSAHRALRLAFEEAANRSRRLVVIQAWQHPQLWLPGRHPGDGQHHGPDLTADEAAVHEALMAAAEPWRARHPAVEMELRSEPGDPVEGLSTASQWAMLMVLGTRCPTDAVQPPKPSVMHRVLRAIVCPALIAHGTVRPRSRRDPRTAHWAAA